MRLAYVLIIFGFAFPSSSDKTPASLIALFVFGLGSTLVHISTLSPTCHSIQVYIEASANGKHAPSRR
jgi:hypothetical protein